MDLIIVSLGEMETTINHDEICFSHSLHGLEKGISDQWNIMIDSHKDKQLTRNKKQNEKNSIWLMLLHTLLVIKPFFNVIWNFS